MSRLRYERNDLRACASTSSGGGILNEVYVKINGKQHYLWRAVDHEGEVLESYVTKRRDRKVALRFSEEGDEAVRQSRGHVTDRLLSYRTAKKVIENEDKQETARWANNRAENSHLPFRRRERAMLRFRQMRSLQEFVSVHASVHNHFNHQRNIERRTKFKDLRGVALVEWRQLLVA